MTTPLCLLPCAFLAFQDPEPTPVHYTIRPRVDGERVALRIEMELRGTAAGTTAICLPRDRYGTPALHEFVRDVRVPAGVELAPGERPDLRVLTHEPGATITFAYTVDFDPRERPGSAYRPSVGREHFHFLGPQWMAGIEGGAERVRDFTVGFGDVPGGWVLFSSFGVGPGPHTVRASRDDLVETVLGGGEYLEDTFTVRGAAVHTYVRPSFAVGSEALFEAVRKIVTHQRGFFAEDDEELLVVTLTPRDGLRAGTSIRQAMICYADPRNRLARLSLLLAHEMFHQWLPNRGRVGPGAFEEAFDWLDEGFTEYFARRLLMEQGLADEDAFRTAMNEDLRELALHPHRAMTAAELAGVHREKTFTNVHYRLSYLRGALIALDWDTRIRAAGEGRTLGDAVRELVAAAEAAGGALPPSEFHGLMARFGIDSRADIERWIEKGEPIVPAAAAFAPEHERRAVPLVDHGFRTEASRERGVLVGVEEEGPAHGAGLRDGMELVSIEDDGELLTVVVRLGEQEREFTYRPALRTVVPQYLPAGG